MLGTAQHHVSVFRGLATASLPPIDSRRPQPAAPPVLQRSGAPAPAALQWLVSQPSGHSLCVTHSSAGVRHLSTGSPLSHGVRSKTTRHASSAPHDADDPQLAGMHRPIPSAPHAHAPLGQSASTAQK